LVPVPPDPGQKLEIKVAVVLRLDELEQFPFVVG
jgi:hypothetical protein